MWKNCRLSSFKCKIGAFNKKENSEVEITCWLESKYLKRICCSGEVAVCAGCADPTLPVHSQEKLWILKQLKLSVSIYPSYCSKHLNLHIHVKLWNTVEFCLIFLTYFLSYTWLDARGRITVCCSYSCSLPTHSLLATTGVGTGDQMDSWDNLYITSFAGQIRDAGPQQKF